MASLTLSRARSEYFELAQRSSRWRASYFVSRQGDVGQHDLREEYRHLSEGEKVVLEASLNGPVSLIDLSWSSPLSTTVAKSSIVALADDGWLVPEDADESAAFRIHRVDIETCAHCNARCGFCPQSSKTKAPAVMSGEIFSKILSGIAPHRPEWVALNHYGEPLLDPRFKERCQLLQDHDLPLYLFTNATLLNDQLVDFIVKTCKLHGIVFNYPSIHPGEWSSLMKLPERLHPQATRAIIAAAESFHGYIRIVVNGVTDSLSRRAEEVRSAFERFSHVETLQLMSNDRAGAHKPLTLSPIREGATRLLGCPRIAAHMHFSVEGTAFLCCQDYHQTVTLGSIQESTPSEIMAGATATELRREIYGMTAARSNLLCRTCHRLRRTRSSR